MKHFSVCLAALCIGMASPAQNITNNPGSNHGNRFEQLGTILPTPNEYRSADGSPGEKYWQQQCDYDIVCELDEKQLMLTGSEKITYYNNSPKTLSYLWLQLDENQHSNINNANYQNSNPLSPQVSEAQVRSLVNKTDNGYGFNILKITADGKPLDYTINKTMMRVELPVPLQPAQQFVFHIDWNYRITDRMSSGGRGGYEYFPEDGNYLFTIAQWYPRLCVYSDFLGWQNHQFTGRGEFALTFGNFKVSMTVPADHVVASTGECQNYEATLTSTQLVRWKKAQTATEPVEIVNLEEAKQAEKKTTDKKKTWIFEADNVRDFAWTSSRRFIWDAMPVEVENKRTMCMSLYGKEAYHLYRPFSTKAVAHTIKTYSEFTIPYPYPVAQSIEAANGMEYPMICFNYGRTEKDGTYSEATKYGMLGVIIHEVGHNFFPMIVNSDERQWSWMDEGLNSFLEYITSERWDNKFPVRGKGPAYAIVDYMKLPKDQLEPIMSNSENIVGFGPNAYSKPATGLNILRETIMGRELFDYAFKKYAQRWAFKHPEPADFFRTMEDASGEDLDWFWRGWFYGTEPCDISLDSVRHVVFDPQPSEPQAAQQRTVKTKISKPMSDGMFDDLSKTRNREDSAIRFQTDVDTTLRDFYWHYARKKNLQDAEYDVRETVPAVAAWTADEKKKYQSLHAYELTLTNRGGLVMPVIIEWTYTDGTKEIDRIPVQVWRLNEEKIVKTFVKEKEVRSILIDPFKETADINTANNGWNTVPEPSRFTLFRQRQGTPRGQSSGPNPMQKVRL